MNIIVNANDLFTTSTDESILFIDIRRPVDVAQSGRPDFSNNENVDYLNMSVDTYPVIDDFVKNLSLAAKKKSYDKIVFSCYKGISSQNARKMLADCGFNNCYSLEGGFEGAKGWLDLGLGVLR